MNLKKVGIFCSFIMIQTLNTENTAPQGSTAPQNPPAPTVQKQVSAKSARIQEAEKIGKKLHTAQDMRNQKTFNTMLEHAAQQYHHYDEFFAFFKVPDELNMCTLARAVALADTEQITKMFECLKKYISRNQISQKQIFDLLNIQDESQSQFHILILSVQVRSYAALKALLEGITNILHDQDLLFQLMTARSPSFGFPPLTLITHAGAIQLLELFIEYAKKMFGRKTTMYSNFINAVDRQGNTALHYAIRPTNRKILIDNGSIELGASSNTDKEFHALSTQLIDSMESNELGRMQRIILSAEKKYADDKIKFFLFITTKDDEGWSVLTHAAANNVQEYIAFILYTVERMFHDKPEIMFALISNVNLDGQTVLVTAIVRRYFELAQYLLEKMEKYQKNKYLLFSTLNSPAYIKGLTPILSTVFYSSDNEEFYDITHLLLETIEKRFGKDSRAMDLFVNYRDLDGFTPLTYTLSTPKLHKLLLSYGAHE